MFTKLVEGGKGTVVITVSEEEEPGFGDLSEGSGISEDVSPCCIIGNCTCDSFLHALVNVTDNVMVYITTDVVLSSIVSIVGVDNITILGYNNPTVHCNNEGGVKFSSCNNLLIEGIVWENCGSDNNPVLAKHKSSNLTIENCTFQQSHGQAISLVNVEENVYINRCIFMHNNHHIDHGTAIFFSSQNSQMHLKIHNCNFTDNGASRATTSIIYINGHKKIREPFSVLNSEFRNNLGIPIYISNHPNANICGKALFKGNVAMRGGAIYSIHSRVVFDDNSNAMFYNNSASYGGAAYSYRSTISFDHNSKVIFTNNSAIYGGAMNSVSYSHILIGHNSTVKFTGNNASRTGGAINSEFRSTVRITNSAINFTKNIGFSGGGAMYARSSKIIFDGYSTATFMKNNATGSGGAIQITDISALSFLESSKVMFFSNNSTHYSGAISIGHYSKTIFDQRTVVTFANNSAHRHGGAITSSKYSAILFQGNSTVRFTGNKAVSYHGGAIYSVVKSDMYFKENCKVEFIENVATGTGGAIVNYNYHIRNRISVSFEGKSVVTFTKNIGRRAGAIYGRKSDILVTNQSMLTFTENSATMKGGAVYAEDESTIAFEGTPIMTFTANRAIISGGAIYSVSDMSIVFKRDAHVTFNNNEAGEHGGAISSMKNSRIEYKDNSTVHFSNNTALIGGAVYSINNSNVLFKGKSCVTFISNEASENGGAVYAAYNSHIACNGNSLLRFTKNTAFSGGAVHVSHSSIVFNGNTQPTFNENTAEFGGAIFSVLSYNVIVGGNSVITFINNSAISSGAIHSQNSNLMFVGNSTATFSGNKAAENGGAVYGLNSDLLLNDMSVLAFTNNKALNKGGALYFVSDSDVSFQGHNLSSSYFTNNTAENGGAVFISHSSINFGQNTTSMFDGNAAVHNGGAVYFSDQCRVTFKNYSNTTFTNNIAERYGGGLYLKLAQRTVDYNSKASNKFQNNYAGISGHSLYIATTKSCNSSCLNNSMNALSDELQQKNQFEIATTPSNLKLSHPAICVDGYDDNQNCETYFVNDIMLGEEIVLDACVLDYYNQPSNAAQFRVTGDDDTDYHIDSVGDILISCGRDTFQGLSIIGKKLVTPYNYTVIVTYVASDEVTFSIKLIVELSPCRIGFQHDKNLQGCICYNNDDVVRCSGSSSTIKRGYWFGSMNGQPTVAVCPINYCDFSSSETTDGFYHLSPLRTNQCRSHRSGPACGNCEEGWTLSFDSAECFKTEKCTTGQTTLVVISTVLYWIAVVVAVFVMMHYKVPIGYLYVITYYYGMIDVLLNQTLYLSQSLLAVGNIIASMFKITPQFLGQLCLAKGMSGIDQQFIHYVHPLAVTVILIALSLVAKMSYKFSPFISKGYAQVVCLLLILSYSSVATTSLVLMRALTFLDVDKIYTYLSPDVEYFHGRHLPYAIVAVLCTIVIVIGLPLLLLLEPFLKSKYTFLRFKPLLDQFQGCYKDKYQCFAAYYMICRLLLLMIIITTPSNSLIVQCILILICIAMATVHLMLRPYHNKMLNTFDGLILLLIISVAALPVFNNSNPDFVKAMAFILVLIPLVMFITMVLLSCKGKIKGFVAHCVPNNSNDTNSEMPMTDVGKIVIENTNCKKM